MLLAENLRFHAFIEMVEGNCPKCYGKLKQCGYGTFEDLTYVCLKCETPYKLKLIKLRDKDIDKKALANFIKENRKEKDERS